MLDAAALKSPGVPESTSDQTAPEMVSTNLPKTVLERPQDAEAEHPDAPNVRRQVEFYFSDENLPTDMHLLQCCGGRENLPVSISRIRGFKKMRGFKPPSMVVAALRKSAFLEVSEDGKTIKRKVPLAGRCLLDEDYGHKSDDDGEIAYDPRTKREVAHPVQRLPQTKQELPPGVTKNMLKPTGFEPTYVEGPLKPEEAAEEEQMYDPDKPFIERIELAIQRFKSKKRMHEMYSKIFNKFMLYGGVDSGPRMFGGLNQQDMKQMDSEEIARAKATHHVPWDRGDEKKWEVDFLGVGEAFLSSFYPIHYGHNPSQVKTACQVLRSFYQYLIFHNVCPEYNASLLAARKLCDQAEEELPRVFNAGNALPGPFNVAASTIFGGSHSGTYIGTAEWARGLDEPGADDAMSLGMRSEAAMVTFKTGVAVYGADEQYDMIDKAGPRLHGIKIIDKAAVGLEVVSVTYATDEAKQAYEQQNQIWKHKLLLQPLGKLVCKTWNMQNFAEYDLPPHLHPANQPTQASKEYEFWVEDHALQECFVGMKMDATVAVLTGGIAILDEVKGVMCAFFRCIPNELWAEKRFPQLRYMRRGLEDVDEIEGRKAGEKSGEVEGGVREEVPEAEFSDEDI